MYVDDKGFLLFSAMCLFVPVLQSFQVRSSEANHDRTDNKC